MDPGGGPPSWFVAVFVLMLLVGVGSAVAKVWWTGELARRRGRDSSEAIVSSLLGGNDLITAATYFKDPVTQSPTVEQRLLELKRLEDQGLISDAEADARRSEILRDV